MSIGYLPRADLSLIVSLWDGVVTAEIAGRKAAILVGEEFPRSSIFERLIQPYGLTAAAFTFLDSACTWLGVDPGEAQQSLRTLGARLREED